MVAESSNYEINDIPMKIRAWNEKTHGKNNINLCINLCDIHKTLVESERNSTLQIPVSPPQIFTDTSTSDKAT